MNMQDRALTVHGINNPETYREAAAKRIKALMEKWIANALAIGAELAKARETFPNRGVGKKPNYRPGFVKWAKETTGLSDGYISNLIAVHEKFGHRAHGKDAPRLAGNVMIMLSRKDVPESARIEALGRIASGGKVGRKDAKKIVAKHKLPGPKKANEQAREEGRPVYASDGNIYFGTDQMKAKEGADRRTMVYGVRDALEHLGAIKLTGKEFLDYAFPHQLWTVEESAIIKAALKWLTDLDKAWDTRAATT